LAWYRDDPDPGIHGAIDWLLRHPVEGPVTRPLDWGRRKDLEAIDRALARRDPDGRRGWYVNGQGQTSSLIQGPVEFRMGAPNTETGRFGANDRPHLRRIGRSYALGTKPVTLAQWRRFLKERPDVRRVSTEQYSPDPEGPVIAVSWFQAAQYCNWLSAKEGIPKEQWCYPEKVTPGMKPLPDYLRQTGYRLPTEAEWEYACRAGAWTSRSFGSDTELLRRYSWHQANSQTRTWPVGQKRPNDLGLFDIHGNVWTWCQDVAATYPWARLVEDEEDLRDVSDLVPRVGRGGSFSFLGSLVRSAARHRYMPANHNVSFGLRVARTLP
jgi:formylglycine-generating enzyme required for sulfatase activity